MTEGREVGPAEIEELLNAHDPYPGLSPEAARAIPREVLQGVTSSYTSDVEQKYRADIERWYAQRPQAGLELPFDIPTTDYRIPEDE